MPGVEEMTSGPGIDETVTDASCLDSGLDSGFDFELRRKRQAPEQGLCRGWLRVTGEKCRASLRNGPGLRGGAKTDLRARYSDSGVPIPECRSASGRSAPRYRIIVFVKYGFVVVVSNHVV